MALHLLKYCLDAECQDEDDAEVQEFAHNEENVEDFVLVGRIELEEDLDYYPEGDRDRQTYEDFKHRTKSSFIISYSFPMTNHGG